MCPPTDCLLSLCLPRISQICTDVRVLSRGCTCLKCTNRAIGAFCFVGAVLALASGKAERRQLHPLGWQRGYGRNAIPSYICEHPCHLWEALLCKRFCVFGAFRGSFFTACSVGAAETAAPPCRNLLQHFEPSLLQVCPELRVRLCHHLRLVDAQPWEHDSSRRERHRHAVVVVRVDRL